MKIRFATLTALVILSLPACAPAVHVTQLGGTFEPRHPVNEISVFTTQTPECEYSEIALITAYQGAVTGTLDGALDALKKKAHEIGADAVVGLRLVPKGGDDARHGYSGTAIRFKDQSCVR